MEANIAQSVEHSHGKGEVIGSIPFVGSHFSRGSSGVEQRTRNA